MSSTLQCRYSHGQRMQTVLICFIPGVPQGDNIPPARLRISADICIFIVFG